MVPSYVVDTDRPLFPEEDPSVSIPVPFWMDIIISFVSFGILEGSLMAATFTLYHLPIVPRQGIPASDPNVRNGQEFISYASRSLGFGLLWNLYLFLFYLLFLFHGHSFGRLHFLLASFFFLYVIVQWIVILAAITKWIRSYRIVLDQFSPYLLPCLSLLFVAACLLQSVLFYLVYISPHLGDFHKENIMFLLPSNDSSILSLLILFVHLLVAGYWLRWLWISLNLYEFLKLHFSIFFQNELSRYDDGDTRTLQRLLSLFRKEDTVKIGQDEEPPLIYVLVHKRGEEYRELHYLVLENTENMNTTDNQGNTILLMAVKLNVEISFLQRLIDKGATNVDMENRRGETPLRAAVFLGKIEIIPWLVYDAHADVCLTTRDDQKTIVMNAAESPFFCQRWNVADPSLPSLDSVVSILLPVDQKDRATFINAQDSEGNTALIYAVQTYFLRLIPILLDHGADPTLKNRLGNTALMYAIKECLPNAEIQMILEHYYEDFQTVANQRGYTALNYIQQIPNDSDKNRIHGLITQCNATIPKRHLLYKLRWLKTK